MEAGRYEPGYMRYVHEHKCAHRIRDLPELFKIYCAGVSRCAHEYHLRLVFCGYTGDLVIVERLCLAIYAIRDYIIEFTGKIMRVAVRKMASACQVHSHDRIARLKHGKIYDHVGLRAGMRLDIDMLGAKKFLSALYRYGLDLVDVFATVIPSCFRITFRIFIGKDGSLRLEDRFAYKIFACDKLYIAVLAPGLAQDSIKYFLVLFLQEAHCFFPFSFDSNSSICLTRLWCLSPSLFVVRNIAMNFFASLKSV